MSEKFRDVGKAVEFVSAGLREEFPDAQAEVYALSRRRPLHKSCSVAELSAILPGVCETSRGLLVDYHPGNAYGFVAELRPDADNGSARSGGRVMILVTQVAGEALAVGSIPELRESLDFDEDFL